MSVPLTSTVKNNSTRITKYVYNCSNKICNDKNWIFPVENTGKVIKNLNETGKAIAEFVKGTF